ncbi:MAG: 4-hydroxythreonine-4-phosphate dehydrogenase PdxA [Geminicoccaceae bacterium]|nr:4-hydroxythreonine-4-phosphate dehydrogenase PdxA [Geminicoccaceae bacterium]
MQPDRPTIALALGDPNGCGPAAALRLVADPLVRDRARMVLVGDRHLVARAVECSGAMLDLRPYDPATSAERSVVEFHDVPTIEALAIEPGRRTASGDRSALAGVAAALELAEQERADAVLFMSLHGDAPDRLEVAQGGLPAFVADRLEAAPVARALRPIAVMPILWVTSVLEPLPLAQVPERLTEAAVVRALEELHATLERAGLQRPRIAVTRLDDLVTHAPWRSQAGIERDVATPCASRSRDAGAGPGDRARNAGPRGPKERGRIGYDTAFGRRARAGRQDGDPLDFGASLHGSVDPATVSIDGGNRCVIASALSTARGRGIDCEGPAPVVDVFRRALAEGVDAILTMRSEQAQIATALLGFDQGATLLAGAAFPIVGPANEPLHANAAPSGGIDDEATRTAFHLTLAMARSRGPAFRYRGDTGKARIR